MLARSIRPLLLVVAATLVIVWGVRPAKQTLQVSHAQIQMALIAEIMENPTIGFLPAVRINQMTITFDTAMRLVGTGNWFSAGAGAFVQPEIAFTAEVSFDPAHWEYDAGQLATTKVSVTEAFRGKIGLADGRPESAANRAGWETRLQQFIDRSSAFAVRTLDGDNWKIVSVASDEEQLTFQLERSGFLLSALGE